jgi:hypothetical protein
MSSKKEDDEEKKRFPFNLLNHTVKWYSIENKLPADKETERDSFSSAGSHILKGFYFHLKD